MTDRVATIAGLDLIQKRKEERKRQRLEKSVTRAEENKKVQEDNSKK